MRLKIRWHLTLWNTLALACVLLVFGGLVYWLLRQTQQRIDQALEERVEHALGHLDQAMLQGFQHLQKDPKVADDFKNRAKYWIDELKEHDKTLSVIYDDSGKPILRTEEMAAASIPEPPPAGLSEPRISDQAIPILGRQRVLEGELRLGNRVFRVVMLASLEEIDRERLEMQRDQMEVDREFRRVLVILLAFFPVALILVGSVGYFLARKALAPMELLHRQAEGISAQSLDSRLPVFHADDELGQLTKTINGMIARLQRSFQEIQRFTADASHELRTPLTAIRTETEVALAKPLSIEEHQQLLGSLLEECERLTRLTDQLLALSREDAAGAKPALDPLDLDQLVRQVADTMRPLLDQKRLRFELKSQGPLSVRGDENRLRRVVINLLDNAIKYTPEGGGIIVETRRDNGHADILIRDSGIGIPAEHQSRVFERFYRVDRARSRAEGGAGLGLSIALSIIRAHGGDIALTSEPGQGTSVKVTMPLDCPPT
jgi:heavy metal sensor kinase